MFQQRLPKLIIRAKSFFAGDVAEVILSKGRGSVLPKSNNLINFMSSVKFNVHPAKDRSLISEIIMGTYQRVTTTRFDS